MPKPLYGQVAVASTATRLASTDVNSTAYTVKAPLANPNTVWIGDQNVTTATGFPLEPGDRFDYERGDQQAGALLQVRVSDFYVICAGGAVGNVVGWLASP